MLCLPDDAAREAVALAEGTDTKIVDASTAHRIDDKWVYGFPELDAAQRSKIASSTQSRTRAATRRVLLLSRGRSSTPVYSNRRRDWRAPPCRGIVEAASNSRPCLKNKHMSPGAPTAGTWITSTCRRWPFMGDWRSRRSSCRPWAPLPRAWSSPCPLSMGGTARASPKAINCTQLYSRTTPVRISEIVKPPRHRCRVPASARSWRGSRRRRGPRSTLIFCGEALSWKPEKLNGSNGLELFVFDNDARGHRACLVARSTTGQGRVGRRGPEPEHHARAWEGRDYGDAPVVGSAL